jgi:DNA-binding response OmpR family regulator
VNLNTHISRRRLFPLFQGEQTIVDFHVSAIVLIKGEFILLSVCLRNPNRLMSRDQLTEQAHNRAWRPFDRGIDVQIGRLRRKLKEKDAETP